MSATWTCYRCDEDHLGNCPVTGTADNDHDFAEGVRRSAEFMRQYEDEPNEFIPTVRYCARCEARCWEEDDTAFRCKGECGEWLCVECKPLDGGRCESCEIEKAEAVAAEAARLEETVQADEANWLRVEQLRNPTS